MIDSHQFCQMKDLHHTHGLKAAQIAGTLSLDPKTVASWLAPPTPSPEETTSSPPAEMATPSPEETTSSPPEETATPPPKE